jgi:hypothetical protein
MASTIFPKDPKAQVAVTKKDDELTVKRADLEALFKHQQKVDTALLERFFILKVAVEDGWSTAKGVASLKAGEE